MLGRLQPEILFVVVLAFAVVCAFMAADIHPRHYRLVTGEVVLCKHVTQSSCGLSLRMCAGNKQYDCVTNAEEMP